MLGLAMLTGCGGMMTAQEPQSASVGPAAAEAAGAGQVQAAPQAPSAAGQPAPATAMSPSVAGRPALGKAGGVRAPSARGAKEVKGADDASKLSGDHMLIFTGSIDMEADRGDIAKVIDDIVDTAVAAGGYVAKQDDRSVTVRVPSKSFRSAMRTMEKFGDVTHRGVQAQDVSEEYHDLSVRLKSLRATRARLEKFLDRAKTMQEVLRVEQELARLNGDIDRIAGRMRFLAQRSSFSTITVSLSAKPIPQKVIVKKRTPPPPPPPPVGPKTRALPIDWLSKVGIDQLLDLR